jgi:hypothetical protein
METGDKRGHYREADYLEFAKFNSYPKKDREELYGFATAKEFGAKYDVGEVTLSLWKKEDKFWQIVDTHRKRWFKERTPEVLLSLYRTILKKGQASEIALWLKYIEEWTEKMNIPNPIGLNVGTVNINLKMAQAISDLGENERAKMIAALEKAVDDPGKILQSKEDEHQDDDNDIGQGSIEP